MEEISEAIHHVAEEEVVCQFCGSTEMIESDEYVWGLAWYCSNWCYHRSMGIHA